MKSLTRRDLLKTSLLAPAVVAAAHEAVANGKVAMGAPGEAAATSAPPAGATPERPGPGAGRERFLLDFGWRFHFGHANDPMIVPSNVVLMCHSIMVQSCCHLP